MKIPKLEKKRNVTNLHGYEIIDDYSWVHQKDILEVLTDKKKLLPEVRDYLEKENKYFNFQMSDTKVIRKKIFDEIFLLQKKRIYNALLNSSSEEVINFDNVLKKIING